MKKVLSLFLVVSMICALAACTNKPMEEPSPDDEIDEAAVCEWADKIVKNSRMSAVEGADMSKYDYSYVYENATLTFTEQMPLTDEQVTTNLAGSDSLNNYEQTVCALATSDEMVKEGIIGAEKVKVIFNATSADGTTFLTVENGKTTYKIEKAEPTVRSDADVRNVKWGDDMENVKQSETAKYVGEDDKALIYSDTLAGSEIDLLYYFDDDYGLYRILYGFKAEHSATNLYVTEYETYKKTLTAKYGEPFEDEFLNNNDNPYIDDLEALKYGMAAYRTKWKTERTSILLGMSADNYKITTIVSFDANDFTPPTDTTGW